MAQKVFITDTNNLETLSNLIASKADEIDISIIEIYTILQTILNSGAWTGEAANTFLENCRSSRDDLNNLVVFLEDYADLINSVSNNAESLSSKISSICKG